MKLFNIIYENFFKKYNIVIDSGLFDITTEPANCAKAGTVVTVKRISYIKHNKQPFIKIIYGNESFYASTYDNITWSFIMPKNDIKIVPVIKRKYSNGKY